MNSKPAISIPCRAGELGVPAGDGVLEALAQREQARLLSRGLARGSAGGGTAQASAGQSWKPPRAVSAVIA